jgi:glycosyltransferase involved in cell wall biosynthesis
MRLVALVESPNHVCCRYRLAAFGPGLEKAGHHLELRSWPKSCWSRLRLVRALREADVVILQRKLLPLWQLYLLRSKARRLVFDFDDAVFLRDSYSPKGLHSPRRLHRFMATVETADHTVAGNAFLAEAAGRWNTHGHVQVIPTCIDPTRYPMAEHRSSGREVVLVWVGSSSTLQGLEVARPIMEKVGQRVPGVHLKLVCDRSLEWSGIRVVFCPWSEEGETAAIASGDIGISWLPDDQWSRGKCGLKVLQYMAAGLPVVANPVGVQADLVRPGETGFLAQTPQEWAEAIACLAADPDLRRRLGAAGRRRVESDFAVATGEKAWRYLLDRFQKSRSGQDAA